MTEAERIVAIQILEDIRQAMFSSRKAKWDWYDSDGWHRESHHLMCVRNAEDWLFYSMVEGRLRKKEPKKFETKEEEIECVTKLAKELKAFLEACVHDTDSEDGALDAVSEMLDGLEVEKKYRSGVYEGEDDED